MANTTMKFLDLTGLTRYDENIKAYIANQIGGAGRLTYSVVETLPAVSEADAYTIYLVNRAAGQKTTDVYDEYLLINGAFEIIGNTEVDFSNYYSKTEIDSKVSDLKSTGSDTKDTASIAGAKLYAADLVANKNVGATGETGANALITASASSNAVTVASTQKLQDAVAAAETAVRDVKVQIGTGTAATIVASKIATLTVAEGTTNGTVKIAGSDVAVHGLDTAAYTTVTALNSTAQGYANAVLGTNADTKTDVTVYGARAYADDLVSGLNPVDSITTSEINSLFPSA